MTCIHGIPTEYCSYCNTERRIRDDARRRRTGIARRVNARMDTLGCLPADAAEILLAGTLSLTASPQHESTLKEQWRAATGKTLKDEQIAIDDAQRERFGTGCWYWYSKITFSATDDEADFIERVLVTDVKPSGKGRWTVSRNALALLLGRMGMEPARRRKADK